MAIISHMASMISHYTLLTPSGPGNTGLGARIWRCNTAAPRILSLYSEDVHLRLLSQEAEMLGIFHMDLHMENLTGGADL